MKPSRRIKVLANCLLWIGAALCSSAAFAQSFQITVDTSTLAGEAGYVDFQFNPADLLAPESVASILDWGGNVSLFGAPLIEGSVTGALPATLSLSNDTAFNDYFQAVQFGDVFSFVVQFNDNSPIPPSSLGTSFALSLYAADALSPLLTDDVSGSIVRFELLAGGLNFQTFSPDGSSPSVAQVSPVPLPAAAWLLLSGMVGLIGASRSRPRAPQLA